MAIVSVKRSIAIYSYIFYGLTRMLMSKNVNNDVTMNPSILSESSLGKQPTFRDTTIGFHAKWRQMNERWYSIEGPR